VLRSSQTREEQASSDNKDGQVTVGNELPGAQNQNASPQTAAQRAFLRNLARASPVLGGAMGQ